jgi:hypothetical protein
MRFSKQPNGMPRKMPMRASNYLISILVFLDSYSNLILSDFFYRTANGCYKDAADLAAQLEQYPVAIENFEIVAQNSLSSPLTRYNVKEYFFKAGLCHLCTGVSPSFLIIHWDPYLPSATKAASDDIWGPYNVEK